MRSRCLHESWAYHGAHPLRVREIVKSGWLKPMKSDLFDPDYEYEGGPTLFITDDAYGAGHYATGQGIVFRFKWPLDAKRDSDTGLGWSEFTSRTPVPLSETSFWSGRSWEDSEDHLEDRLRSLKSGKAGGRRR